MHGLIPNPQEHSPLSALARTPLHQNCRRPARLEEMERIKRRSPGQTKLGRQERKNIAREDEMEVKGSLWLIDWIRIEIISEINEWGWESIRGVFYFYNNPWISWMRLLMKLNHGRAKPACEAEIWQCSKRFDDTSGRSREIPGEPEKFGLDKLLQGCYASDYDGKANFLFI